MAVLSAACMNSDTTAFSTFQSHSRKVVWNNHGLFMTYLLRRGDLSYTAQTWRLVRSADGGRSFETLYESTDATNPPPIETDAEDNILLVYPDWVKNCSFFLRFSPADGYRTPAAVTLPGTIGGKFAACLDRGRGLLYYVPNGGHLHVLDTRGNVVHDAPLVRHGKRSSFEYPHLCTDEAGAVYLAWTTDRHGSFLYDSIRVLRSDDRGRTWRRLDGRGVSLPADADDPEASTPVTAPEEAERNKFLASFAACRGKLHFMYRANPLRADNPEMKVSTDDFAGGFQRYVRFDTATGARELDVTEKTWCGLAGMDGFLTVDARPGKHALYFTGKSGLRQACAVSYDDGGHWQLHAQSEPLPAVSTLHIYATQGCREVAPDGRIYGAFTLRTGDFMDPFCSAQTWFLSVEA